jgi:hypothetical protein
MIQSYCKDPILCTCGEVMKPNGEYMLNGEFRGEDIALGHGDKETAMECPKCNGSMFKKK